VVTLRPRYGHLDVPRPQYHRHASEEGAWSASMIPERVSHGTPGQVRDAGLFYTTLLRNRKEIRIPNSLMVAAVVVRRPQIVARPRARRRIIAALQRR
jgi:hypothetical protein